MGRGVGRERRRVCEGRTGCGHVAFLSASETMPFLEAFFVIVEEVPTSFSPFSLVNCTLISHFSFDDFIALAFLDLAGDLDLGV